MMNIKGARITMSVEMKSYPINQITKLDVNCKIFSIKVVKSSSFNIELSWSNTVMRSLEIQETENVLKITDHAAIGIYGTLALINLKKDAQLLIKIPSKYTGKIILQTREESIHVSNISADIEMGIATSTGKIIFENVCTRTIDIRGNSGKTEVSSIDAKETIVITSKNGEINCGLLGIADDYTVSCITKNRRCTQTGTTGSGRKKVLLKSEYAMIRFQFQNEVTLSAFSARYNRHGSFKDW